MKQIYYTQCPIGYGLGASNGFQIKRLSPGYPISGDFRHLGLRAFVPGSADEAAWIAVNNRAFVGHPDQSGMTTDRLHDQLAEDWFDAEGFRLHERDGRLAAFCWTKRHPAIDGDPAMGEIYVVGVDPDAQGGGLGKALTLAGLQHLREQQVKEVMLYVESDNAPAVRVYTKLGFTLWDADVQYAR